MQYVYETALSYTTEFFNYTFQIPFCNFYFTLIKVEIWQYDNFYKIFNWWEWKILIKIVNK